MSGFRAEETAGNRPNPDVIYKQRRNVIAGRLAGLEKRGRLLIAVKLILIVGGLLLFSRLFDIRRSLSWTVVPAFAVLFIAAAAIHEKILARHKLQKILLRIQDDEIRALAGEFPAGKNGGAEYADTSHLYAADIDIFGERSLFHLVDRTATGLGREKLAGLLRAPLAAGDIRENQDAVRELSGMIDFRHSLQAHGSNGESVDMENGVFGSLFNDGRYLPRNVFFTAFLFLVPGATYASVVLAFFGIPWETILLLVLLQSLVNKATQKKAAAVYHDASRHHKALAAYAGVLREIERGTFRSSKLNRLKKSLASGKDTSSRAIRKLAVILEWMDSRAGGWFHVILNNTLFWNLHCVRKIEAWKAVHGSKARAWLETAGEADALCSLGNLAFNNPDWAFPGIEENGFRLNARDMGHPLIPAGERIPNDFEMAGAGRIAVITGPNMAGKSTFLRTIGTNAVLAFCGGPVCAGEMTVSPFRLATSMKSVDSLERHMSLFYAELERLKLVLDSLDGSPPAFFMIDEMLKGTNAMDRNRGSTALVGQLLRRNAAGIVATHDLELTHFAAMDPRVRNYHFDGTVREDKLFFDFKIKEGICESFNALALMKKMGIDV